MWEEISDWEPARQRDALLELVPAIIDKYADTSSTAAAEWYQRVRDKWISDDFKAQTPTRSNDDISRLIRAKAGVLFGDDADPMQMLRFLNGVVDKGVKQGGRDAIRYNARRDPKKPRYARVPSGAKTCAFCAMLASRGWVYESAETAGALNKYHAACDCEIVPSWDKDRPNVEGYDPEKLYADYEKARHAAGKDPNESAILSAMRRLFPGGFKDSIKKREIDVLRPQTLAGVKRGKPMTFEQADNNRPNPNFMKSEGYRINCQSCVVTYEARLRGYDVETLPNTKGSRLEWLSHQSYKAWVDPKTGKARQPERYDGTTSKNALKWIRDNVKPGERYTLGMTWRNHAGGHIVSIERMENGTIRLYDPQSNEIVLDENKVDAQYVKILRADYEDARAAWGDDDPYVRKQRHRLKAAEKGDNQLLEYLREVAFRKTYNGKSYNVGPRLLRIDDLIINPDVAKDIMKAVER